ncbi:hypothetical protein E3P81_02894 [Wallemia ichthyophaga]|nr:hypothetical protein E3P97_02929 [Wallemia ichthyophaga]TIB30765.1 hypothetical protein E3P85_02572 [Wallemia ichthyophaga]TIB45348.1 hypothetical protein E3P82_02895 [Wallemia ichthyophaga]TIB48468.1 hypothetical protein E3P81_02894 [Wallemia ichthyophaga]TIB51743.1 hypothetical protein E3P80_02860 [Wallemia ichthyophaga]
MEPPLPQLNGYCVLLILGFGFSALMLIINALQRRYGNKVQTAEEFNSASRSVPTGLISSGVVSAWCWSATLLTSTSKTYSYGLLGSYSYATGACLQILVFSVLASSMRIRWPYAHSFVEIAGARWGKIGHYVFLSFALSCNLIVSAMLIVGISDTLHSLTNVPVMAAVWLTPLSVSIYIMIGGLKASLIADYLHTIVLYGVIIGFCFYTYTSAPEVGSLDRLYDMLVDQASRHPVEGNADGSYLTFRSLGGITFFFINLCGNFGTVYLDQAYVNRAVASQPRSITKSFVIGSMCWYPIPFALATCLGLAGAALKNSDAISSLSSAEVTAGLPASAAASALMGNSGANAVLIMLFLASTAASSAELVAVSTLVTYDVFNRVKPNATDKQTLFVSHASVAGFGICQAVLGIIFHYIGIGMGWLYELMGIILCPAVAPLICCIMWSKANKVACIGAALISLPLGIMAWIVTAYKLNNGVVDKTTTGQDFPMLAGNTVSFGLSIIISVVGSLISPDNHDFEKTKDTGRKAIKESEAHVAPPEQEVVVETLQPDEKSFKDVEKATPELSDLDSHNTSQGDLSSADIEYLTRSIKLAAFSSLLWVTVMIFTVTFALYGTGYILPRAGFKAWVSIGLAWLMVGAIYIIFTPILESLTSLKRMTRGITLDVFTLGNCRQNK